MTLPRVYIDPPAVTPYRFGLFGAAEQLSAIDGHWRIGGVEWESLAGYVAATYPAGALAPTDGGGRHTKALPDAAPFGRAFPFGVYAGVDCGSIGFSPEQFRTRALEVLALSRQHAVEYSLWTGSGGLVTNAPVLALNASGASTVLTGTQGAPVAVSLTEAISRCEGWLGDNYAGVGMLHAKRTVAPYASKNRHTHRDPENAEALTTALGTRWVFGAGYDGTGPAAQAPGANKTWLYATGKAVIAADEPVAPASFGAALNRSTNREFLLAEQLHMVGIDGPWAAALVDFTL